ncbi:FGGY-family carbohydrate kinase [Konateibacter massiliensis]|uniref:FGGY-family carbohydrate kinase n=1 Tax=Konateibacter massiliensis TaxID=2002841 RepID=UPI000C157E1A|nr:glycerol kinase [Konateibacter massiliensis]
MEKKYILSLDQSTQGTKALLFDQKGTLLFRADVPHKQIINEEGWVSHDLNEIYRNTIQVIRDVVNRAGIDKEEIAGIGISNQRETSAVWSRLTGKPVDYAIVWQCSRAKDICKEVELQGTSNLIREKTGMNLSPFFPASKFAWFLQNVSLAKELNKNHNLMFGTIDTWLVYKLTRGASYKTDYSNASRTQLFNINTLEWDNEICSLFGLKSDDLAQVCDSNANYGKTDLEGFLDNPIPIHSVLGDSHGALYGQGCLERGMIKATYGTGSSVMVNVGTTPVYSSHGVVTSIAWGMDGKINYVMEGNINYTGAVITWLQKDLKLIQSAGETTALAEAANPEDKTYIVPAFTGLGAPYWDNEAKAIISGISRTTGQAEIVKAALECIAYQITDIIKVMEQDSGVAINELRVDGGPTKNRFLMQFQSDITDINIQIPDVEELSGIGAAYAAGIVLGLFDKNIFSRIERHSYESKMTGDVRDEKYNGWKAAVGMTLAKKV